MKYAQLAKWDLRFMELAAHIATWSKDPTQVGAIIVGQHREIISTGFNGFPPNVQEHPSRQGRPDKYLWTAHAERNAIDLAAARGCATGGTTMYSTLSPCADCARGIIQSGIITLFARAYPKGEIAERWVLSWMAADAMLQEAGVEYFIIED